MRKTKLSILLLGISMILVLCGCSKKEEQNGFTRVEGHYGYTDTIAEIPYRDGMNISIKAVMQYEDNYYVSAMYYSDQTGDKSIAVFQINQQGEVLNELSIAGERAPSCIAGDCFVVLTSNNEISLLNIETGNVEVTIDDIPGFASRVVASTDGFIVFSEDTLIKYNSDGNVIDSIQNEAIALCQDQYPYFEDNGNEYFVAATGAVPSYYKLSFENGTMDLIADGNTVGSTFSSGYGMYIINDSGEYKINFADCQVETLALWDEVNVRPEVKNLRTPASYYVIDDYHFSKVYEYGDGSADVLLFEYDSSIDYSNYEVITVGGYGVNSDLSIRYATYLFNSSNETYRVQLIDFAEMFPYTTGDEAEAARLELIQYFNSGNAPDIFYGDDFDYNNWGECDMVQDLSLYLNSDSNFSQNTISPAIYDVLVQNGTCYQLFSSYSIYGYWGLTSNFSQNSVSINELLNSDVVMWGATCSSDIANETIRYALMQNGSNLYSVNELETLIDFAVNNGLPSSASMNIEMNDMRSVAQNQYLLSQQLIGDVYSYAMRIEHINERFTYVGFPSLNGSMHVIRPDGIVAMSSATEHADVCWDFMKFIISDDVQMAVALNQRIPVNQNILDDILYYAQNPESSADTPYHSLVNGHDAISAEVIDDYLSAVNSVDTVLYDEWGMYNIITEEVDSYELMGKSPADIANSMHNRLETYLNENYG